jgi:hypothetical protein
MLGFTSNLIVGRPILAAGATRNHPQSIRTSVASLISQSSEARELRDAAPGAAETESTALANRCEDRQADSEEGGQECRWFWNPTGLQQNV